MRIAQTIGNRRVQITFQQNAPVSDGAGGSTDVWSTYFTTWAMVNYLSASRRLEDNQVDMNAVASINMRYRSDKAITDKLRILYEGRILTIQSVINIAERNKEIEIRAIEKEV